MLACIFILGDEWIRWNKQFLDQLSTSINHNICTDFPECTPSGFLPESAYCTIFMRVSEKRANHLEPVQLCGLKIASALRQKVLFFFSFIFIFVLCKRGERTSHNKGKGREFPLKALSFVERTLCRTNNTWLRRPFLLRRMDGWMDDDAGCVLSALWMDGRSEKFRLLWRSANKWLTWVIVHYYVFFFVIFV